MSYLRQLRQMPLLKDARNFQILFQSAFLLYGIWALDWEADIYRFATLMGVCLMTQFIGALITKAPMHSLKSALITSLGLSLLFKSNSYLTLALAAFLAIGGKFVFRHQQKHVFNPANFGIVATILLTGDGWVSPGQWGSQVILLFFIGAAGLMVLLRCGRVDTSLAFIGTLFLLEFSRTVLYQGWGMDVLMHKFTNGSLLLFTFFMITDPVTTPNAPSARLIWAALIATVTFFLGTKFQVHTAPVWALFFISPITPLFDRLLKGKKFEWIHA